MLLQQKSVVFVQKRAWERPGNLRSDVIIRRSEPSSSASSPFVMVGCSPQLSASLP